MQTYQRESKPIQDVYAQVTQLFNTAPDLLEDFKQFLPESAAHAKQQAAAAARQQAQQQQVAEEAVPLSNMRVDMTQPLAQGAQGPNVKMPPLGHFNVKDTAKEGKKRRGGPGAPSSAASGPAPAGPDAGRVSDVQGGGRFSTVQNGNVNKVSNGVKLHFFFLFFFFCPDCY